MGYPSEYSVITELFGTRNIRAVIGYPGKLADFFSKLPAGSILTPEYLIHNHTLFPLLSISYTKERLDSIKQGMIHNRKQGVNLQIGRIYKGVRAHSVLMFCPKCVKEQRENYGEAFWLRLHQVPGVLVCHKHRVWLKESTVSSTNQRDFISAEKAIQLRDIAETEAQDCRFFADLLALAENAEWLLQHSSDYEVSLPELYVAEFIRQDLATYSGNIRKKLLVERVLERYDQDMLAIIGCNFQDLHARNWLACIVEKSQIVHPIRHLLMIRFLGYDIAEFLALSIDQKPFGDKCWPCLNKHCIHYQKSVIEEYSLGISRKAGRKPIGTFVCPYCGYTYCRSGMDKESDDRFKGRVVEYGQVWDAKFIEIWTQTDVSRIDQAKSMSIDYETLNRQAIRLGLIESKISDSSANVPRNIDVQVYRNKWRDLINENPSVGSNELRVREPDVYWNLYRHDYEWLSRHTPDARKKSASVESKA
jgi:hypothetical protein